MNITQMRTSGGSRIQAPVGGKMVAQSDRGFNAVLRQHHCAVAGVNLVFGSWQPGWRMSVKSSAALCALPMHGNRWGCPGR